jgi:ubiquitin-protein ligase E3 C
MSFQTFTGSSRKPRQVNLSGRRPANPFTATGLGGPSSAVATAKEERERRQRERATLSATKTIQRYWRGHRDRKECHKAWRREWDARDGRDSGPYHDEEASIQLRLLLRFMDPKNSEDGQRLRKYLARQAASWKSHSACFSTGSWPLAFLRLQRLVLKVIDVASVAAADASLFQGLAMTIDLIPDLTARNARPVYRVLRHLVQRVAASGMDSDETSRFILQTALPPLKAITAYIDLAYEAFACELLTLQDISKPPLLHSLLEPLADGVNYKVLSNSLTSTLRHLDYHGYNTLKSQRSRASLLGCLIFFHRRAHRFQSSFSYSSDRDFLSVVSSLLSSVPSVSASDEQDEDAFLTEQITSLVNNDSISSFIPNNTANLSNSAGVFVFDEEAKQIASFALALLRHFPLKSEDIRIRLYMSSTRVNESSQARIPAIRFFWQSVKTSRVVSAITKNLDAVIPLLKGNKNDGSLYTFGRTGDSTIYSKEACQDEWRVILLFLELYSFALRVMDDEEFFSSSSVVASTESNWASQNSLPIDDLKQLVFFLKNLGYSLYFNSAKLSAVEEDRSRDSGSISTYFSINQVVEPTNVSKGPEPLVAHMPGITIEYVTNLVTGVLRSLYERDSRRPFLDKNSWLMMSEFDMDSFIPSVVEEEEKRHRIQEEDDEDKEDDMSDDDGGENSLIGTGRSARIRHAERLKRQQRKLARSRHLHAVAPRLAILQNMPFFIPFETRVQIFREFIRLDKVRLVF